MAHNDLAFLYLCFICFLSVLLIYYGLFWFTFSNHSIDFPRYHSIPVSILYLLPSCLLSVFCTKCEFHKGLCLFCLIHKTPHWCLGHISWIYEWMNKWIGILIWNRGKKKKLGWIMCQGHEFDITHLGFKSQVYHLQAEWTLRKST